MKKFTKVITKTILTLASLFAFYAHAGETATPTSSLLHYDQSNWPGFYEIPDNWQYYNNGATAIYLDDIMGAFINRGYIRSDSEYGIYSKNTNNTVVIENYDYIKGIIGVDLVGTNGILNNYGIITGSGYGVVVDSEAGNTSNINDFWITNEGTITSTGIAISQLNDNKKMTVNNTWTGNLTGNTYAILSNGVADITNDGLIQSQNSSAIFLIKGGSVTNNGIIKTFSTESHAKAIHYLGLNGTPLTLKGSGSYTGNITFGGDPALSMSNGILEIESDGIDFENSRLENWGAISIEGGNHYFNVQNDAQNPDSPFTQVLVNNNAYIHTGAGSWGDADFTLMNNSLLNPYKNQYDVSGFYWDRPALKLDTNEKLYDRKEFEKLTVHNLTLKSGSALVMDVRYSEPDYHPDNAAYDEDDRAGYWDDLTLAEGEHDPDGSYGGFGYSDRVKKVHDGGPGDLYTYQRVNYDKIVVAGTADIESGTKLYLLDHSKWLDASGEVEGIPGFVEEMGAMKEIKVDLFDGNIQLDDFDIDFYSDYYGIDHIDNNTGKVYLTRDAYGSNVKSQIDWWIKEASLGFPDLNPWTEITTPTSLTATTVSEEEAAAAAADQAASLAQIGQTEPAVGLFITYDAPGPDGSGSTSQDPLLSQAPATNPVVNSDDDDDDDENHDDARVNGTKSELLPYQIGQEYSSKITDLDKSLDLRNVIYSFQSWNDLDAFMDSLNKLEYASLATSNLNLISNRVAAMYNRLGAGYDMRDANNVSIWGDLYFSNDSLDGTGNHGIDGQGTEFVMGFDKLFNDKFTLGMSFNYTDYESVVNDSGMNDKIDSEGFGLSAYAMLEQGALTHKMMLGYTAYENTGDMATFDSNEMFAAYRAEYKFARPGFDAKWIAGVRYSLVQFDEIREDSENGLKAFDQDSLETELGLELSKQFKRLGVSLSGVWMHEFLDSQITAEAFTSFGDFSQKGIARDTDSVRATIGIEYKLSDKVTLDFDYAKELSSNSESDSVNGKITFRF